jgi:putative flippase GtrA
MDRVAVMESERGGNADPAVRGNALWRGWLGREWLRPFILRTARYGVVGVTIASLYSGLVILFQEWIRLGDPDLASLAAFCIALPVGYVGHWAITFERAHRFGEGWRRFLLLNLASFFVAVPGMHLVTHVLGLSYLVGIAATWVVAPSINYVALQLWVFSHRRAA